MAFGNMSPSATSKKESNKQRKIHKIKTKQNAETHKNGTIHERQGIKEIEKSINSETSSISFKLMDKLNAVNSANVACTSLAFKS